MKRNIKIQFEPGFKDCDFAIEKVWFYQNKLYVLSSLDIPVPHEFDTHVVTAETGDLLLEHEFELVHYLTVTPSDIDFKDLKFLNYKPTIISNEGELPEFIQNLEAQMLYVLIKLPVGCSDDSASNEVDPEVTSYFKKSSSDESEAEPEEEGSLSSDKAESDDLSASLGVPCDNSFKPIVIESSVRNENPSCFSFRNLTFFAAAAAIGGLAFIQQTYKQPNKP